METVKVNLEVVVDQSAIEETPTLYSNYAEVRANPEEVYLTFYQRLDQVAVVEDEKLVSRAVPKQVILVSPAHALRLAAAILNQVKALGENDGTDNNIG